MKDYYAILDVPPTASQETIREQYLFLIQAWHPDKFSNPAQKTKAEEKCKHINLAYDVLKNLQKRAEYDRQRTGQSSLFSEEQRRRQAEEQRQRKQAEEKQRRAEYERLQREQAEKERRRIDFEREEAEARANIRELVEYAQARRKQSKQPLAEVNRTVQNPIRVLIVASFKETRAHLRKRVSGALDIKICGEASNGKDAIRQFNALMPDVMTTDIHMPVMDGIAATAEICRQHPGARAIMISVQNSADYIRASMLAGACDYLVKPPTEDELISAIRRAAEQTLLCQDHNCLPTLGRIILGIHFPLTWSICSSQKELAAAKEE